MHPSSSLASKANNDVLCYHQVIKAEDADDFREAIGKEVDNFKETKIFELVQLEKKPPHKSLIPSVQLFKQKQNLIG